MPRLDPAECAARLAAAPVARLATLRPDGTPRLVPITFALVDGLVCSAIDTVKPKSTTRLARLDDVRRDPRVGLLVDTYDDDWAKLWWVRVDGVAAVRAVSAAAQEALATKYVPYAAAPPAGDLLVITVERWAGWTA